MQTSPYAAAVLIFFSAAAAFADPPADPPTMAQDWADLAKPEPVSTRALLRMATTPDATVAFLKDKLKPLTLSTEDLNAKLTDLSNDDEKIWRPAFEFLEYYDPRLAAPLETIFNQVADPVGRSRLVALLGDSPPEKYANQSVQLRGAGDGHNFFDGVMSWWAEDKVERINVTRWGTHKRYWTRLMRALTLLHHIDTPDAQAILADVATGNTDAAPTKVAKDPAYEDAPAP